MWNEQQLNQMDRQFDIPFQLLIFFPFLCFCCPINVLLWLPPFALFYKKKRTLNFLISCLFMFIAADDAMRWRYLLVPGSCFCCKFRSFKLIVTSKCYQKENYYHHQHFFHEGKGKKENGLYLNSLQGGGGN